MSDQINIPGYRIERKLGQGGMAAVYLAIQQSFEREVALKIMSPLLNSDPSFTTRFIREARIVAHIHHSSIVPVYDVGEHQPFHYLSMEYLPGGDLKHRILKGPCDPDQVVDFCVALCGALDVAHRKGFIHRDIKPENVLFREDGTPVLTDFGIARALDRGASLTVAGMLVGTPSYMSPEQVKGVELDARSDLYSLGIVCYEMLTGTVPFRADSSMSVALKHLSDPMPPLPADLSSYQPFIDRLTAKDRNERFSSGSDAVQALRQIHRGHAAASEATILRPIPPEITAMLAARKPQSRVDTMLASIRSFSSHLSRSLSAAISKTWAARARLPDAHQVWKKVQQRIPKGESLRWIGAGSALIVLGSTIGVMTLRSPSPTESVTTAAVQTPPAAAAPTPTATSVTTPPEVLGEVDESTHAGSLEADTPVIVAADPVADEAAAKQQEQAEARERKRARKRLEEIEKENAAIEQRQKAELIQRLLAAAKKAYSIGAYTRPVGDSAADRYAEILKLQPDETEAIAGMRRIADLRVEEARRAIAVNDTEKARGVVEDIARIQPQHPALVDLEVGLATIEASPQQQGKRQAAALERANKHIQKSYSYLDRKPFDQRTADLATDEYDIAAAQMPMAPDLPALKERIIASYSEIVRSEIRDSDSKGALRMISYARKRKWLSAELEELELTIRQAPPAQRLGAQ